MTRRKKVQRLRVEFEFVPHGNDLEVERELRNGFHDLLKKLTDRGVVNLRDHGASMTFVETTPFEWDL